MSAVPEEPARPPGTLELLGSTVEGLLRRGGAIALVTLGLVGALGGAVAGALVLAASVTGNGGILPLLAPTVVAILLACTQAGPLAAFSLALRRPAGFEESFGLALRSLGWLLLLAHAALIPLGVAFGGYALLREAGNELLAGNRVALPLSLLALSLLNLGVQVHARSFVLAAAVIVAEEPGLRVPFRRAKALAQGRTPLLFAATIVPLLVAFAAAPTAEVSGTARRLLTPDVADALQTAGRLAVLVGAAFVHALLSVAVYAIARGDRPPE